MSVSSTCGRNSSHSWIGHVGSSVARLAMKWSLNVAMARSAALAMIVWWDELDFYVVAAYKCSDGGRVFVVHYVEVDGDIIVL